MKTVLPWTIECEARHEKVVAIEKEAKSLLGFCPTRRQARKAISGRGSLPAELAKRREKSNG